MSNQLLFWNSIFLATACVVANSRFLRLHQAKLLKQYKPIVVSTMSDRRYLAHVSQFFFTGFMIVNIFFQQKTKRDIDILKSFINKLKKRDRSADVNQVIIH